jgi:geranylgeranyl diphosphate synthase type II
MIATTEQSRRDDSTGMMDSADPDTLEDAALAADRRAIADALQRISARRLDGLPPLVADAIRYSLAGEGKRLRAILFLAAYRAAGGKQDATDLAAVVEVVHAYSLVHDDLPCMDNDDMRRGRPTVHRVFGVPAAAAAGLAMVPLAAQCAVVAARELGLPRAASASILRELMRAAGAGGMIGGQLLDIDGEGQSLSLDELERVHRLKTGALVAASVRLGGIAAGAGPKTLDALQRYGAAIGLAFQIADDILDVTATTHQLGKTAGRDRELGKNTYPALLGIAGAKTRAQDLVDTACAALASGGLLTPALEHLARFTVSRRS